MVCKGGSASLMLGLSTKYPRVNSNRQISSAIRCTCNLSVVGKLNCGAVWEQKVFRKYQMKKLVRNKCSADGLVAGLDMRHRCLSQNARRINEKNAFRIKAAARSEEDVIDVEGKIIDTRIPTTILTGFLGSGKTTLLNHILSHDHGHKIAVIENEFGEIDVDSDLVSVQEDIKGEGQIMMLNNGCLCCTVRGDLVRILDELYSRRDQFDRIIIETTGLANPAPIIQTFFLEPSVADTMRLDGVVTVIDAKHIEQHLDEEKPEGIVNESVEQIAYADRIILNKTDLVGPEDIVRLEKRIETINSLASIKQAQQAKVSMDYVLGIGGFDLEKVEDGLLEAESSHKEIEEHSHQCDSGCNHHSHDHHDHGCEHEHHHHEHHHDHSHDESVKSISLVIDGEFDVDKVNFWLGSLLELRGEDIFRTKGVLAIDGFERRFVFQGVHMLFEGMPDREWKEGEKRTSKMVFIGRDLDEQVIREGFEQCLARKGKN